MKKYILLILMFIFIIPVNAKMVYIVNNDKSIITNNDYYNNSSYSLDKNQILVVSKEDGLLSNDSNIYTVDNIVIMPYSENSNINDLNVNIDGSFTYTPNKDVVGNVMFKYYVVSNGVNSNESIIEFYIKNTIRNYYINYYDNNLELIIPTITKKAIVNSLITEIPIYIDGYYTISDSITKEISNKEEDNTFNFYYVSYIDVPKTGLFIY